MSRKTNRNLQFNSHDPLHVHVRENYDFDQIRELSATNLVGNGPW